METEGRTGYIFSSVGFRTLFYDNGDVNAFDGPANPLRRDEAHHENRAVAITIRGSVIAGFPLITQSIQSYRRRFNR